jgi:hypothetical protein
MAHDEFPPLTHQAKCVLMNTTKGIDVSRLYWDRRFAAAVIREAIHQLGTWKINTEFPSAVDASELRAIADNLHALPPPPPTREQMDTALQDLFADPCRGNEWLYGRLVILQRGIAHHCKEQP